MNIYTKLKNDFLYCVLLVTIPIISIMYNILNNKNRGVHSLVTDIDKEIPFNPVFILPYMSWFVFVVIVFCYICFKDKKIYLKTLAAYDICLIISFFIYYSFQTTVPRPIVLDNNIFGSMVKSMYNSDKPFNCFPSIHCISCYLMIKAVRVANIKNKFFQLSVYIMSILIMLSTLFVKQHVILDVIFGILLGQLVFEVISIIEKKLFEILNNY